MVKKTGYRNVAAAPSRPDSSSRPAPAQLISLQDAQDQQRLLNIFADAFGPVLSSESFSTVLQEIKQALFNRDFAAAFGREDYVEAYAARWSPTRALCYATVFLGIRKHLNGILASVKDTDGEASASQDTTAGDSGQQDSTAAVSKMNRRLKMVSIGGCAAEHLAFASYLRETNTEGVLGLLDSAPWASITALLQNKVVTEPPLSNYASAAAKAANKPLLDPGQLSCTFAQQDVLSLDQDSLFEILGAEPIVVTMLFTLNELYTSGGIGKTTKLLKNLGQVLAHGSLILVIDSPGSYSEAAIGKEKKKYPMQWLLDHTLTGTETPGYKWEKLQCNESIWFRLPEELLYPIPLENMRYQIHLYRIDKVT